MSVRAVRGAVQIERDTADLINKYVGELINKIITENSINKNRIISIQFTVTKDLRSKNPASALRKYGYETIPLFCSQEPDVDGAMERVIRVLITFETDGYSSYSPVYLNGAERLRPDLQG